MAKGNRYELDMLNGPLGGKLLVFALPLMASGVLQLLFNAADIVVVGRYVGNEALAAVGSNTALINLLIALFMGLSVGTNVALARDMGAGRMDQVSKGVHTAILLSLLSGAALTALGLCAGRELLVMMACPEDVIESAALYLRIYFLGMPAAMVYNFGSATLRAQGDTKRTLYYLVLAGVFNVLLKLWFVLGLGMGVAGAAASTAISQYLSAGLVLWCLTREKGPLRLELKKLCLDKVIVGRILQVGLPAGFQSIVFSISNVAVQSTVNSFGSTVMSGCAASQNIEGFIYTAMVAFHQTAITFAGQNYGAGRWKRVDKVAGHCVVFVTITGLVAGMTAWFFGPVLLGIYAPGQDEVIAQGMIRLGIIARASFICGVMDTLVGVLRGLGSSFLPMMVSLVGACGLRLVWIYTVFPLNPTLETLFLSYPISWSLTALVQGLTLYFVRKKAYAALNGQSPAHQALGGNPPASCQGK